MIRHSRYGFSLCCAVASLLLAQSASAARLGANEWVSNDGVITTSDVLEQRMSQNGRFVVYNRKSLTSAFLATEAYRWDRQSGDIEVVATPAQLGGFGLSGLDVDNNGVVVFETAATLDPVNDFNSSNTFFKEDVYLTKPGSFAYQLVSRIPNGNGGDLNSNQAKISADGNFVAFTSSATNFNAGSDTNNRTDVYRFDLQNNVLELVSRRPASTFPPPTPPSQPVAGATGSDRSLNPSITNNGRFVAYQTRATNLSFVADGNGGVDDVVTRDMDPIANPDNNSIYRAFVSNGLGAVSQSTMASTNPAINRGDYGTAPTAVPTVAFLTEDQLRSTDTNTSRDVYIAVGQTAVHVTPNLSAGSGIGNAMDVNGLAIVFSTNDQLTSDDNNSTNDIYIYSTNDGNLTGSDPLVELVSAQDATGLATVGADADDARKPTVSDSGKLVSFITGMATLNSEKDINGFEDVYLRDRGRVICEPIFFNNKFVLEPNLWYQLSLPCNPPIGSTVADILEDDLDGNYLDPNVFDPTVMWAGYTYDPVTGAYEVLGPNTVLNAKQGFWLLHTFSGSREIDLPQSSWTQASTFRYRGSCKSSEDGCTQLRLSGEPGATDIDPQWNMLGNPYGPVGGDGISMDDIRYHGTSGAGGSSCVAGSSYVGGCDLLDAFADDFLVPVFFNYDPQTGAYNILGRTDTTSVPDLPTPTTNEMNSWEGYWIGELQNSAATVGSRIVVPEQ